MPYSFILCLLLENIEENQEMGLCLCLFIGPVICSLNSSTLGLRLFYLFAEFCYIAVDEKH